MTVSTERTRARSLPHMEETVDIECGGIKNSNYNMNKLGDL